MWLDRNGKETPAIDAIGDYRDTSRSPPTASGSHMTSSASAAADGDSGFAISTRGVSSRFTFDAARRARPAVVA